MEENVLKGLIKNLTQKLNIGEPDKETLTLLEDELIDAESEVLLELNLDEVPSDCIPFVVDLAAVYYRYDVMNGCCGFPQVGRPLEPSEYQKEIRRVLQDVRQRWDSVLRCQR